MVNPINNSSPEFAASTRPSKTATNRLVPFKKSVSDRVDFGGKAVTQSQSLQIVTERAYEKLRNVVAEARAALGLPAGAELDTSPDATANRIADFALGFFSQYAKNNKLEDNEASRAQYAEFIGNAINQGIGEARNILGALQALNPDIESGIDKTASIIQQRLDDFIANGLAGTRAPNDPGKAL